MNEGFRTVKVVASIRDSGILMYCPMMKYIIWETKYLGGLSSIGVNFGQFKCREMHQKQVRPPANWEPSHHVLEAGGKAKKSLCTAGQSQDFANVHCPGTN